MEEEIRRLQQQLEHRTQQLVQAEQQQEQERQLREKETQRRLQAEQQQEQERQLREKETQRRLQAEQQQEQERQRRLQVEQQQEQETQRRLQAEQQQEQERRRRVQAEHNLQFAYVFLSTTMPEKEKGRLIVLEKATATAASFDVLFAGCGLQVTAVDLEGWPTEPVDGSESSLQSAVEKLLRDSIPSTSHTVLSFASNPMLFCTDKPDIVFVSSELMGASGLHGKCSWPMVSFVAELKPSLFSRQDAAADALQPGHLYVDAGLEAVGQLANRAQRFHHDETFFGLVMGKDRVQFWRYDAGTRNWTRWPASGVGIFDGTKGERGIDYLAAVFRGDAARLRPLGRIDDLTAALSDIRQVRDSGDKPLVPMCGLRDNHALLVQVDMKKPSVMKLWKDGSDTKPMDREQAAMSSLLRTGVYQVAGGGWRGLKMDFLGPVTLHDLVPYIDSKIRPRINLWKHMLVAARQIAVELRRLHELGYVHCDVKPRNVVIKMQENEVVATLIDFEHTVPINADACGYTMRYCAKYVLNQRAAKFPARCWQDWAALFYSLQSLIVHEEGHERFDAMMDPDAYWMRVRAPVDADANLGRLLLQGMKHLAESEQTEAVDFMNNFAGQFQRTTLIDDVPTELEDQQLEARMRSFWK